MNYKNQSLRRENGVKLTSLLAEWCVLFAVGVQTDVSNPQPVAGA